MTDPRRYAAATLRNRDAILSGLERQLPARGLVRELASGSGEHAVNYAARLRALRARDPAWGVRAIEAVAALAAAGFSAPLVEEMPANNLSLSFRRLAA